MTLKQKHTELPWAYTYNKKLGQYTIRQTKWVGRGETTALCHILTGLDESLDGGNAKFVVKAVNNHENLIEMVKELQSTIGVMMASSSFWSDAIEDIAHAADQKAQALLTQLQGDE